MAPQLFINYKVGPAADAKNSYTVHWCMSCPLLTLTLCFSVLLYGSDEVCESPAGDSVDVQSECVYTANTDVLCSVVVLLSNTRFASALSFSEALLDEFIMSFSSSPLQGVNTLISDLCSCASLLSSSGSFCSSHQLSCFRDELLFFLYLYQRRWDTARHKIHVRKYEGNTVTSTSVHSHHPAEWPLSGFVLQVGELTAKQSCCHLVSPPGVTPTRPGGESPQPTARN